MSDAPAHAEFIDTRYFPEGMPEPDPDDALNKGFWDACREGRLTVQQCDHCGARQYPPEINCHACGEFDLDWQEVAGRGTVWSMINCVHPVHPALDEAGPYNVALIQLDDAPDIRMVGNIIDIDFDDIAIGMPVRVVFERTAPGLVQPRWRAVG